MDLKQETGVVMGISKNKLDEQEKYGKVMEIPFKNLRAIKMFRETPLELEFAKSALIMRTYPEQLQETSIDESQFNSYTNKDLIPIVQSPVFIDTDDFFFNVIGFFTKLSNKEVTVYVDRHEDDEDDEVLLYFALEIDKLFVVVKKLLYKSILTKKEVDEVSRERIANPLNDSEMLLRLTHRKSKKKEVVWSDDDDDIKKEESDSDFSFNERVLVSLIKESKKKETDMRVEPVPEPDLSFSQNPNIEQQRVRQSVQKNPENRESNAFGIDYSKYSQNTSKYKN